MRRITLFTLLFGVLLAAAAFAGSTGVVTPDNGIIGDLFVDFIQSVLPGAGAGAAIVLWSVVVMFATRLIQFALSKMPTYQRSIFGKLFWGLARVLFGREVAEANNAPETPVDERDLIANLKKRYPVLRTRIR